MHKKLLFIILFLPGFIALGQQAQFFDAPFGGGIGYVPAWYIPEVSPVNKFLPAGMPELSTSGFYSSGIAGFIYIGFVKNLRVGGMGFGGSINSTQKINTINREVVYSLGGGGVTFEYTLPFIKNFGVSIGTVIGAGNMEIHLYGNNAAFDWNAVWEDFSNPNLPSDSYSKLLTNSFWMITPTLNVDYPIYRFVSLRLGVGYQITFASDWTADNDQPLSGVPSNINSNSFFIQSGIFVGFFSY
ncbi:MAG: hypothetical protein KJN64_01200 [Ignavibacteria bacterium]|nr:hypothetical protein [Ignavibacteria bacterium]MBT8383226.1 hypothetical protein [Ignavibacteria bacterium]MBT8392183.1 hypothetical protein [Ignavibacteria bacterium]NNJ53843.1 hypothetical protein [Ignavibacteriaceae bacterium]NNL20506.1 hypothetical protein [Ignavibacteriaceae bacterium]